MKIALIGYGKMGKMVEQKARLKGHEIHIIISRENLKNDEVACTAKLQECDVAIEFTTPASAVENIAWCLQHHVPVVSGTTGWYEHLEEVQRMAEIYGTGFIYGSNFSIGVTLFQKVLTAAESIFKNYPDYQVGMKEWHHQHKLDAPSGTALSLSKTFGLSGRFVNSAKSEGQENPNPDYLSIESIREGNITGIHQIRYRGICDEITLRHTAFNREGFADGALFAAEWVIGKKQAFNFQSLF